MTEVQGDDAAPKPDRAPPSLTEAASFAPIFAIFQGGGAKGITHVGALKAIEEERFVPVGVAGTSAGAIIAALVAVGYRADDLLDPVRNTTILGGKSPTHWLGRFTGSGSRRSSVSLCRSSSSP